ncbi:MAG: Dihydrofolate reductase [uncultured bacterium]|nr:MAG: Dihydrofolate reductase [uncultured bacterium]
MKSSQPILSAIAAISENRVIGKANQLLWRLPADLKHFKSLTSGHPIIMGRKTYESIGKPLPNRKNIVLTRDSKFQANGCQVVTTLADAIKYAKQECGDEIFIIGGADIYQQALPEIDRLYLTIVHHEFDGDAYFPLLKADHWKEIACERHGADADNPFDYSFLMLEKK